jgi:cytoskeletal protein CcmA (bactofilin family)
MLGRRRKPPGRGDLTAFIDEGSEFEGKYSFSGAAMLNGRFKGEIYSTDTLIIGEQGVVNADIVAGQVLISGHVVGHVRATARVELRPSARVLGDIEAPILVVEAGALLEGQCRITRASPAAQVPAARTNSVIPLRR